MCTSSRHHGKSNYFYQAGLNFNTNCTSEQPQNLWANYFCQFKIRVHHWIVVRSITLEPKEPDCFNFSVLQFPPMKNGNNHSPSILEFLGEVNKLMKEMPGQLYLKGQLWLCNTSFILLPFSFLLSPSLSPFIPKTITELLSHSHCTGCMGIKW